MVTELPSDRVWVSDIHAGAVAFQREHFGVHGFVSTHAPEDLKTPHRFDVIVVSSLFTHLPRATFTRWLKALGALLTPAGLLMFSVHDESLLPSEARGALSDRGIVFREVSETTRLPKDTYGTSWVSEAYVRAALAEALGDCRVERVPRGFANYQDLYAVAPAGAGALPPLVLARQADGFVDRVEITQGNHLVVAGWVTDRVTGQLPVEVRVLLDGDMRGSDAQLVDRPDVAAAFPGDEVRGAGFEIRAELPPDWSPAATLSLVVATERGETAVLYSDRLEGALLRSARLALLVQGEEKTARITLSARAAELERQLEAMQTERDSLTRTLDAISADSVRLLETIAWMRQSRFWKLRERWFAVKRFLRITTEP
jgi:hypothetical protein